MTTEARRYDAICLWHAIEHMAEPWRVLEAAAAHGKAVWVLDRPNPAGRPVEGLTLRPGWESFVGAGAMPMRPSLTSMGPSAGAGGLLTISSAMPFSGLTASSSH